MSPIAELVDGALRGEPGAFERLVERFYRTAYSVALSIVAEPSPAEDVVQESFIVVHRELPRCRDPERFAGWLLQIVRNRARNHRLNRAVRAQREAASEPPREACQPQMPDVGLRRELLDGLSRISEREREIVLLHDLDGWTHPEIAESIGISVVASRQHLFQARRKLRAHLEARGSAGGDP